MCKRSLSSGRRGSDATSTNCRLRRPGGRDSRNRRIRSLHNRSRNKGIQPRRRRDGHGSDESLRGDAPAKHTLALCLLEPSTCECAVRPSLPVLRPSHPYGCLLLSYSPLASPMLQRRWRSRSAHRSISILSFVASWAGPPPSRCANADPTKRSHLFEGTRKGSRRLYSLHATLNEAAENPEGQELFLWLQGIAVF